MDQYKGGKGGDRPFYLSAWSGHPVQVDRAKHSLEPIFVPHPYLTVVGGLTTDMTSSLAEGGGRDDGFVARVLFAYPDPVGRPCCEAGIPARVSDNWRSLVEGLWARRMREGEFRPRPNLVAMGPEARRAWADACNAHRLETQAVDFPRSLEGAWGKLEQYAARLALILHLMREAAPLRGVLEQPPPIDAATIADAWWLVGYFKSHAGRFYAEGRRTPIPDDARGVLAWAVRSERSSFTEREVRDSVNKLFRKEPGRLASAIDWMREQGAIRPVQAAAEPSKKSRKPSSAWTVHPVVLAGHLVR